MVAGTGTASVQINFLTQRLGVTATFADQAGDLPGGVDLFDKKVRAATAKLGQTASKPTKGAKLGKQARALLRAIDKKAAALAKKKRKGISAACRQSVGEALAPALRELDAGRF